MIDRSKIVAAAAKWVGTEEQPLGSNWGPGVEQMLHTCHISYPAPWCAAAVQTWLVEAGYGTIANDSASAYYIGDWCQTHGMRVFGPPHPADIVVYYEGAGHIGLVQEPVKGGWWAIEGNHDNGVQRVLRQDSQPHAFFRLPNVRQKPHWVRVPRFECVGSRNGHEVVLFKWGKYSRLAPLIPKFLARGYSVRIRRKLVRVKVNN